jgi:acetylornithine deacetylase/succinyl-diaminopimelate desuccinylase-like protein
MQRLALSDADKLARDWFVEQAKILGCEIKVDSIGNIFAVLPGENMDFAPIGMGSHLDTQPAGRFPHMQIAIQGYTCLLHDRR